MGLGPALAIPRALDRAGVAFDEISVFEINEAFAAQVLACRSALASDEFARTELGRSAAVGDLDDERLNPNGGAIALGHPIGATGARLVVTLLAELVRRGPGFGVASLCVGGGQGAAVVLERAA
jgi:acetyl-CoA acetyltransferase